MKGYFRRLRWLRRKKIEDVEATALQMSWCAFIRRWNSMLASGDSLPTWLKEREGILAEHSLSDLRWRICNNVWSVNGRIGYVSVVEGCGTCGTTSGADWQAHIAEFPLGEQENAWIQRYRRSLAENDQDVNGRGDPRQRLRRSQSTLPVRDAQDRLRVLVRALALTRVDVMGAGLGLVRVDADVVGRDLVRALRSGVLIVEDNTRGILKEIGAGFPRVLVGRKTEPANPITARGRNTALITSSCSRWILVLHKLVHDAPVQQHQQGEEDRRDGNAGALARQDDLEAVENRVLDPQLDIDEVLGRLRQAQADAEVLRQQNRELVRRVGVVKEAQFGRRQGPPQRADHGDGGGVANWPELHVGLDDRHTRLKRLRRGGNHSREVLLWPSDVEGRM
ncbi:hypothetical protein PHMEG_00017822 [Phytophthora megakarya]|uniref:Uncharacterized protein n=1 Tax=Phytophthora megakarya TaxID=4795 RepID=A0A225VY05_9STRA|nr:hypothetical protein PHMEG_00017822 [Phytophthora megakarya]